MNPVEEFLGVSDPVEKHAGWLSNAAKSLGKGLTFDGPVDGHNVANVAGKLLTTGAVSAGIGTAAHMAHRGIDSAMSRYQKPKQYAAMVDANPTLKEMPPKQVQAYFNALHAMAPAVAAEPLLAGSFVRNMTQREVEGGPAVPLETAKMMTEISKNLGGGGGSKAPPAYLLPLMQGRVSLKDISEL